MEGETEKGGGGGGGKRDTDSIVLSITVSAQKPDTQGNTAAQAIRQASVKPQHYSRLPSSVLKVLKNGDSLKL